MSRSIFANPFHLNELNSYYVSHIFSFFSVQEMLIHILLFAILNLSLLVCSAPVVSLLDEMRMAHESMIQESLLYISRINDLVFELQRANQTNGVDSQEFHDAMLEMELSLAEEIANITLKMAGRDWLKEEEKFD
jgi:hypothetical protein